MEFGDLEGVPQPQELGSKTPGMILQVPVTLPKTNEYHLKIDSQRYMYP